MRIVFLTGQDVSEVQKEDSGNARGIWILAKVPGTPKDLVEATSVTDVKLSSDTSDTGPPRP